MKRAILVALGTGALITSAAALSLGTALPSRMAPAAHGELDRARLQGTAREAQRETIESRYRERRAQCDALGGRGRDDCLIAAHAFRGRALLQ